MDPLFKIEEIYNCNNKKEFPFKCEFCGNIYYLTSRYIKAKIKTNPPFVTRYCSDKCKTNASKTKMNTNCSQCYKPIEVSLSDKKKSKSGNNFCSRSCAATYNNTHKTTGTRRSKLEKWLEGQLIFLYPKLDIKYNTKEEINSELDIYIPSLNLAFELNGIFHYEPIYGAEKLASIQNNDNRKFQACLEQKIELVIIDTATMNYFKESKAQKYLNIITNIITHKLP